MSKWNKKEAWAEMEWVWGRIRNSAKRGWGIIWANEVTRREKAKDKLHLWQLLNRGRRNVSWGTEEVRLCSAGTSKILWWGRGKSDGRIVWGKSQKIHGKAKCVSGRMRSHKEQHKGMLHLAVTHLGVKWMSQIKQEKGGKRCTHHKMVRMSVRWKEQKQGNGYGGCHHK